VRWLRPAATRARSILVPTSVVVTATLQPSESQSPYVIHVYVKTGHTTTPPVILTARSC
jgi:hypothetical protein